MTGPPPPPPPGGDPRHGAAGRSTLAGAPTPGPGDPAAIDPLSNRLLWIAGLLGVLLVAVLANAALNNNEGGLNPVAQAAERTARMPGAKLAMEVSYSSESSPTVITGSGGGAYDAKYRPHRGPDSQSRSRATDGDDGIGRRRPPDAAALADVRRRTAAGEGMAGDGTVARQQRRNRLRLDPGRRQHDRDAEGGRRRGRTARPADRSRPPDHPLQGRRSNSRAPPKCWKRTANRRLPRSTGNFAERSNPDAMPIEVWVDDHGLARRIRIVEQIPTGDPARPERRR